LANVIWKKLDIQQRAFIAGSCYFDTQQ